MVREVPTLTWKGIKVNIKDNEANLLLYAAPLMALGKYAKFWGKVSESAVLVST